MRAVAVPSVLLLLGLSLVASCGDATSPTDTAIVHFN
jgi:hypothetical protein